MLIFEYFNVDIINSLFIIKNISFLLYAIINDYKNILNEQKC